jgi:hypothetical protein
VKALGLVAAMSLAALTGCSGFDRIDFTFESAPPDNATVTYTDIRIHAGIAVGVLARPMDGNDEMDEDTDVVLESRNPSVLGVSRAVQEDEDDPPKFVLFGVSPGSTVVTVRIDGNVEGEIPANVDAQ